jgi:hypothetical protein
MGIHPYDTPRMKMIAIDYMGKTGGFVPSTENTAPFLDLFSGKYESDSDSSPFPL